MTRIHTFLAVCLLLIGCSLPLVAQSSSGGDAIVPRLVNFSGKALDDQGKAIAGVTGITFAIYKDQEGGAPLWMETQNVQADKSGHYTVQLGASNSSGLPMDLFSSGEARWLGVQVSGEAEQARTLLLSVPYALKAMDAETLGGMPASAFLQAIQHAQKKAQPDGARAQLAAVTGSGTTHYVPVWTGASTIGNSTLFESTSGRIGLGTTAPAFTLDVHGTVNSALGVTGLNAGANAGVSGTNTSSGFGLYGLASGASGQGVWGESDGTTYSVSGSGPDGVHGVTHTNLASGVAGINTASGGVGTYGQGVGYGVYGAAAGNGQLLPGGTGVYGGSWSGTGVYGTAPDGLGFATDSNVQQARTAGGWAKALLFVNASQPPYTIQRCFNSALIGPAATAPPCGFNLTENPNGSFSIDMGFEVDDRFVTATASGEFALPWILFDNIHTYNILWYQPMNGQLGAGEYYWLAVY